MVIGFVQFTYFFVLRDIETTRNFRIQNLYRSRHKAMVNSTIAEVSEKKDWLIFQDFAQVLILEAKDQYAGQKLLIDLDELVYALDSSNIFYLTH